jgi:hypothetical protein
MPAMMTAAHAMMAASLTGLVIRSRVLVNSTGCPFRESGQHAPWSEKTRGMLVRAWPGEGSRGGACLSFGHDQPYHGWLPGGNCYHGSSVDMAW